VPAAPSIAVQRDAGGAATLAWSAPPAARPQALTITINSPDEREPPRTENVVVDGTSGEVPMPGVDPAKTYDIHVSTVTHDGLASPATGAALASNP
jgi:hypothetical protein